MTWRAREERHADPRAPHGQRVMQALADAQGHTLNIAQLRLVTGLDTQQVYRAMAPMIEAGSVVDMGSLRFQLRNDNT
jgi:hypothetical protein